MSAIRGVIFDLDGVLVDSNAAHVEAWVAALAAFGRTVAPAEVWPLVGMGGDKVLPALSGLAADGPEGRPIIAHRQRIMADLIPRLRPFPRARELVLELRARGLRLALASSGERADVDRLLAIAALQDGFDVVVCSADVDRSKPDPDLVEAALARLELPAAAAVMIGDTRYDVAAARRAGVAAIALRCGDAPEATLAGAVAIYDDLADLLARLAARVNARW